MDDQIITASDQSFSPSMMVTYNDGDDLAAMIVLNNANSQRAIAIVSVCPGKIQVKYQIID